MKRYIFCLILVLSFIISIHSQEQIDFILAKVGREVILFSDLARQVNQMQSARMWDDSMTYAQVLDDMIEARLIVMKAKELNIRVDERRIKSQAETQINTLRARYENPSDFFRDLRQAGLTPTDLRLHYEQMITDQFLRDRLIQTEIRNKLNITDSEIYEYFIANQDSLPMKDTSYELSMILRNAGPSNETISEARRKINDIKERIQRGEDFARLARNQSDCPSAAQGGDLGYFTRGMMVPEFDEVAFNTGINEISDIVRTQFGFHIIMVTDKTDNEIRASHILIMIKETEEDIQTQRDFMNTLYERLNEGEDFTTLAIEYSQDEESKENNGIVGILTRDEFPLWFADELHNLQVGEISPVLENANIFYIFTINEEFPPRQVEFDEIKDDIKMMMMQKRQIELYTSWMENLKKETFVQIHSERIPQ